MRQKAPLAAALALSFAPGCMNVIDVELEGAGAVPSWEDFRAETYRERSTGVFIVDGDVPILDEKKLWEFYQQLVMEVRAEETGEKALVVHTSGGADVRWNDVDKRSLRYCVSTAFGSRYNTVVQAMTEATGAWEAAANIDFIHVSSQDTSCNGGNTNVVFDVNPVNTGGQYLARAFFPYDPRSTRNVFIDPSAFSSTVPSLIGILRHELGHTLGFRHEHTRPEAAACFEDNSWRALTPYDSASVMHYPQCNGSGDFSLSLTATDAQGAASLYGAPTEADAPPPPPDGEPRSQTVSGSVAQGGEDSYGPVSVVAGTTLSVQMSGSGDPDLYVRFGSLPTTSVYDCRPYLDGANETCSLTVPAGASSAYIMVRGYTAASYTFSVAWVEPTGAGSEPPTSPPPSTSDGAEVNERVMGSVGRREMKNYGPFSVVGGKPFVAAMTGSGDPDLYVRFGSPPTRTQYDCRPYLNGAEETCDLTAPGNATEAYIMVRGYTAASYDIDVTYWTP